MRKNKFLLLIIVFQFCLAGITIAGEKFNQSVDLGGSRQGTWYIPDSPPTGWILLQHGFQRNKNNLDDLATFYMDNGLMVLTINSSVTRGNRSLARNVADDLIDNPLTPPNGIQLPDNLVIAGHSAGGLFMSYLGGRLMERNFDGLRGVILFDPVDANNGMNANLQAVINNGLPVLSILANSSSCNSSNNALQPLRALSDLYVGIKLTDNSKHTDVEGSSTGGILRFICGAPAQKNVSYLKDFSLNWAKDMMNDTYSSDYYFGGAKVEQLLGSGDGELIKEVTQPEPPIADFSFSTDELDVQFNNNSIDNDGSIDSYFWEFGDGQSSTQENPSHSYAAAGNYNVILTVTDNDGQSDSNSKLVTVNEATVIPSASFTYSANNLSVNFTDTSSASNASIASREWSFGDGNSSSETNPVHVYSQAGSYSVTLTVTDSNGLTDSSDQEITVTAGDGGGSGLENGAVLNNLSASRNDELYYQMNVPAGAENLQFKINGGSGDADLYVRYGSTPTTSQYDYRPYRNGNNETVTVASPEGGEWFLMIRAYQSFSGVTLSASYELGGNEVPTAGFSYAKDGLSVSFTDDSFDADGSIVSRLWSFGDGAESNEENPIYAYSLEGSYTVTLMIEDDQGATAVSSQVIEVSSDGDDTLELNNGDVISNLSAATGEELNFVLRDLPAETVELILAIQGGGGDADIYVRYGSAPTQSQYDYRPYRNGNNETVNIPSAQAGDWYVMIRAYRSFSGVTLSVSHTVN